MTRKRWGNLFALCLLTAGVDVIVAGPARGQDDDGGFTIRGRVIDGDGKGVANAVVRMFAPGFQAFHHHGRERTQRTLTILHGYLLKHSSQAYDCFFFPPNCPD